MTTDRAIEPLDTEGSGVEAWPASESPYPPSRDGRAARRAVLDSGAHHLKTADREPAGRRPGTEAPRGQYGRVTKPDGPPAGSRRRSVASTKAGTGEGTLDGSREPRRRGTGSDGGDRGEGPPRWSGPGAPTLSAVAWRLGPAVQPQGRGRGAGAGFGKDRGTRSACIRGAVQGTSLAGGRGTDSTGACAGATGTGLEDGVADAAPCSLALASSGIGRVFVLARTGALALASISRSGLRRLTRRLP